MIASISSTRQLNALYTKKKREKKKLDGFGSVEQVVGLICITSPLEHFTHIAIHYTQVNTPPDFKEEKKKSERLFGTDI